MHRQASVEVTDDEEDFRPRNQAPINPSHILELADGSDDDNDVNMRPLRESESKELDTEDEWIVIAGK